MSRLSVVCPDCDGTFYATTAGQLDEATATHNAGCPGQPSSPARVRKVACPDCGKALTEVGTGAANAAEQERRALALHAPRCPKRPAPAAPPETPPVPETPRLEDPPPSKSRNKSTRYDAAVELAVANIGRWVRLPGVFGFTPKVSGPTACHVFHGYTWSIATRTAEPSGRHVWIRCDGQKP